MLHMRIFAALAIVGLALPAQAAEITGQYVEVRNCDVWTGPCFANAEGNLTGQNAAMVWRITEGTLDGEKLDGLSVVAVIQASDTLGTKQTGQAKAVVITDSRATEAQRKALVKLVQMQGGQLVENIVATRTSAINVNICGCEGDGCAEIDAGVVKIKTRCLHEQHDKHCGNEIAFYPPLIHGAQCVPAVAEHRFTGDGLASTWQESERRGAYVGTFTVR